MKTIDQPHTGKLINMESIAILCIIFIILILVVWRWVVGIDHMMKNHPDYKGDDLFGEFDEDDKDHIL